MSFGLICIGLLLILFCCSSCWSFFGWLFSSSGRCLSSSVVRLSSIRYLWLLFLRWSSLPGVAFVFFSSSRPPLTSSYASLVFLSFALFASLPFCLWVTCASFDLCLSCNCSLWLVRLLWYFAPSLVLGFCRSSSLVASSSPPYIGFLWFLFIFFVTRSNLSSFATGSSLWAELSRMVSLSAARHVDVLQAVAAEVSSPGGGLRICLIFLIPCSVCVGVYPLPRSFQVPSSRILWGLFQMCSYSVWFMLCGSFCAVLMLFLHVLAVSLCLLIVLLALSLRPLCPSFSDVSFSILSLPLLPLLFLLPLLHLLLVLLLHFLWVLSSSSRLRGFFFGSGSVCGCSCIIEFL